MRSTSSRRRGSAQGIAAGVLADACGKSLSLTWDVAWSGYSSSTIFHLLYRFSPEIRTEFGRSDEHRWIQRYGFEEVTVGKPDDDAVEDGRNSKQEASSARWCRERPGLVPIGPVPHHRQHRVPAAVRRGVGASGLRRADPPVLDGLGGGRAPATPSAAPTTTVYERAAEGGPGGGAQERLETAARNVPANPPGLPRRLHQGRDGLRPQDAAMSSCRSRRSPRTEALPEGEGPGGPGGGGAVGGAQGRWSTSTHTGTRDITGADGGHPDPARVQGGGDEGRRSVSRTRREAWVADKVKQGIDVMICHPQAGADRPRPDRLPNHLVWFETEFSVFQ